MSVTATRRKEKILSNTRRFQPAPPHGPESSQVEAEDTLQQRGREEDSLGPNNQEKKRQSTDKQDGRRESSNKRYMSINKEDVLALSVSILKEKMSRQKLNML